MSKSDFYTRDSHNEGVKLSLHKPGGAKTKDYLIVRGKYSDEFRTANTAAMRQLMSDELDQAAREEVTRKVVASLVADWSFDEPCTPEAVIEFLTNAPQIEQQINIFANKESNFLAKK